LLDISKRERASRRFRISRYYIQFLGAQASRFPVRLLFLRREEAGETPAFPGVPVRMALRLLGLSSTRRSTSAKGTWAKVPKRG